MVHMTGGGLTTRMTGAASVHFARLAVVVLGVIVLGGCASVNGGNSATTVLPPTDAEPGRWVILDGANNTRDIGGYRTRDGRTVRWRTVYRSGSLTDLTPAGCEAFRSLGVRRVIGLTSRSIASPLFGGEALCVFEAAAVDAFYVATPDDNSPLPAYVGMMRDNADSYRRAFEVLAVGDNLPLLYHCNHGKDRTGVMTALLLTLLGVERETVMADFLLSDLVGATVDPQAMTDLLDEVDRQGGIGDYLAGIGVSTGSQTAIRDALLE